MKKNILFLLLPLLLLTATGCGSKNTSTNPTSTTPEPQVINSSLPDLAKTGKNIKCTVPPQGVIESGTTYVANGKIRSDYSVKSDTTTLSGHVIIENGTVYVWSEDPRQTALTFKLADLSTLQTDSTSTLGSLTTQTSYTCTDWSPDESLFTPPATYTFTDYSDLIQKTLQNFDKPALCNQCNKISDTGARNQCRQALGC